MLRWVEREKSFITLGPGDFQVTSWMWLRTVNWENDLKCYDNLLQYVWKSVAAVYKVNYPSTESLL